MRFAVETWDPAYGVGTDVAELERTVASVDCSVERAARDWAPVRPATAEAPTELLFVDGVRRFDARIWISDDDGAVHPGVCASIAAGVVRCRAERAEVTTVEVRRGVFAAAGRFGGPIATRHATYELYAVADDSSEGLYLGVHEQMTALETSIGDDHAEVVVFDGPLRGRTAPNGVGYVKTQHVQYLPDEQHAVAAALQPGERTPIFLVSAAGFTRWSWYLRLPGPISHPFSGVVRCELPAVGTAADAAGRADVVSTALPRFASESHKDSRAPQNLYPIAGLERDLRRRLGDQQLLERALRSASAAQGPTIPANVSERASQAAPSASERAR